MENRNHEADYIVELGGCVFQLFVGLLILSVILFIGGVIIEQLGLT